MDISSLYLVVKRKALPLYKVDQGDHILVHINTSKERIISVRKVEGGRFFERYHVKNEMGMHVMKHKELLHIGPKTLTIKVRKPNAES